MADLRTIDVHSHILLEDTMARMQREAPDVAPKLSDVGEADARLFVDGLMQYPFPRGAWDLELRLRHMDEAEVDVQVLSNVPQTFLYDCDTSLAATLAAIQNDAIAATVRQVPDRFLGIANLPMQAPEAAARELRRAMTELGLRGAQIGSHVRGRNLDDPSLEPLWETAAELGAFILVHPQKIAGDDRMKSFYLRNLVGNPLDTTIAAASLVFGGVLERHPNLTFCLSHGGGFAPYQAGRWIHGWNVRPEPRQHLKASPEASIRRLYFDCILHFEPALHYLVDTFGADHVLLGSDYPFDMGMLDCVKQIRAFNASEEVRDTILAAAAAGLLGVGQPPARTRAASVPA